MVGGSFSRRDPLLITAMRQRRAGATAGTVSPRFQASRRALARGAVVVLVAWLGWAFADEAWTASRLAAQASDLRHRNAVMQAQNDQYQRDIATVESGAAGEEVARENGYAKPGEHIYVVATPAPAAPASPGPGGAPSTSRAEVTVHGAAPGPFDRLGRWLSSLWTRRPG